MNWKEKDMTDYKDALFAFDNLHVSVEGKNIVEGVSLAVKAGEKHALMGPNGSGKSSLANALMGHPNYTITAGKVYLAGEDITEMAPDERSRKGLFLAFQYPHAVPGVTVANFLRSALQARQPKDEPVKGFRKQLKKELAALSVDEGFAARYVNDGFSGGEKKRIEILQMAMLEPRMAILDETDSGLDIDALKVVSEGINRICDDKVGVLLVTHYQRILDYVTPNYVHVMMNGKIVRSGGPELALELEKAGYEGMDEHQLQAAGV
jgi:Fe-S cluster assembly ATP-binding protein